MKSEVFYIAETFESIQGEGNCAGANSLFIRFQHCNLTCSWCDTKFTWNRNPKLEAQAANQIKDLISEAQAPNVIFTGGEPTLYALDKLVVPGKRYHVETNGTIIPTDSLKLSLPDRTLFERDAMDESIISEFNWVISPKMSNANQLLNEKTLCYWIEKPWCIFKFIIQNSEDLAEVHQLATKLGIAKHRVYIGLEGCTPASQLKPELVDEIRALGYNFSPRLHVLLWGAKRKK